MLVNDHMTMLREANRVLRPGKAACFTIWGNNEDSLEHSLADKIMADFEKSNGTYVEKTGRSNFDLYADKGL